MVTPDTASPIFRIPPLPTQTFESYDEAENAPHAWNRNQIIDVTIAHNKKNKAKEIWQRDFKCDKYGRTQNNRGLCDEDRVRTQRGTSKIGCPMKIRLEAIDPDNCAGKWKVVHLDGSFAHNHPPSEEVGFHPGHRRRDMKRLVSSSLTTTDLISSQTLVGTSPESVVASIRQAYPDTAITTKDVQNHKDSERRKDLASDTATEMLLKKLADNKFFYNVDVNPETSRLRYLFWSHSDIKQFLLLNSNVIIMDCTYKTNEFNLPLLNIIAMTNMNTVLPVAQCWLPGETEEDFIWALTRLQEMMFKYEVPWPSVILTDRDQTCMNALEVMFPGVPSIVCRWHMNRNVLAKARIVLGQVEIQNPMPGQEKYENSVATDQFIELYHAAVCAGTEADFDEKCTIIRSFNAEMANYLDKHWWKYKTKIVRCWTNQYLHFGYRDTSPVEGTHAKCKKWLESSRGNLLTAFRKLLPWWESSIRRVANDVEKDCGKVPHYLQDERYSAIVMFISRYALKETSDLWKQAHRLVTTQSAVEPCTGVFRHSFGRPCVHDLIALINSERQQKLQIHQYHWHWLTSRGHNEDVGARILEPAPIRTGNSAGRSKRHKKNNGKSGTARNPSFSERVDLNHPANTPTRQEPFAELLLSSTVPIHCTQADQQLPPIQHLLDNTSTLQDQTLQICDGDIEYLDNPLPPRSWGNAGRNPF